MPFPESPRVIFGKNPIVEVVCQLRFSPVLKIITAPPAEFQDEIRNYYPLYERQDPPAVPTEIVAILRRVSGTIMPGEAQQHRFLTADKGRTLTLGQDFVAVTETAYERWELYRNHVLLAKEAVEALYGPIVYQRVGLRYRNQLKLVKLGLQGQSLRDLLTDGFVGVLGAREVAAQVLALQTSAIIDLSPQVPGAKAHVRFGMNREGTTTNDFVIDSDFFLEPNVEAMNVPTILDAFNRLDGHLFRWAIRRDGPLWAALDPRPV